MFHWVQGIPFEFNAGAYDNLNLWEQIDNGDQYTPTKKFLLSVPVILFLISTHYTHYDLIYFMINFLATLAVVIPKLPAVSRSDCPSSFHQLTFLPSFIVCDWQSSLEILQIVDEGIKVYLASDCLVRSQHEWSKKFLLTMPCTVNLLVALTSKLQDLSASSNSGSRPGQRLLTAPRHGNFLHECYVGVRAPAIFPFLWYKGSRT